MYFELWDGVGHGGIIVFAALVDVLAEVGCNDGGFLGVGSASLAVGLVGPHVELLEMVVPSSQVLHCAP